MNALRNRLLALVEQHRNAGSDELVDSILLEVRNLGKRDIAPAMQVAERGELDITADEYLAMHRAIFDASLTP